MEFGKPHDHLDRTRLTRRIKPCLPPQATEISLLSERGGHYARYKVAEADFMTFLDGLWAADKGSSAHKRDEMAGEGEPARRESMAERFKAAGWEPLDNAVGPPLAAQLGRREGGTHGVAQFGIGTTCISPPSSLRQGIYRQPGPTRRPFQEPPATSKFLAVSIANQILKGRHYFLIEGDEMDDRKLVRNTDSPS